MPISFYFIIPSLQTDDKKAGKFLYLILLSAVVPLLIGAYQYINQNCIDELSGVNRIYSTFGHSNVYAMFLMICILLTSYLYLSHSWFRGKMMLVSYLGFLFFSLFNTFARIGWGTCAFSLLTLGILMKKKFIIYIFAALVIIFLLVSSVSNLFLERIKPDYSALSRLAFNQVSLSFFAQRPILGAGLGTYQFLSLDILGTRVEAYGKALGFAPHNDYFKFLVENGLIGLVLYLLLMYSGLRMGIKLYKSNEFKGYGALVISLVISILLYGLTDAGFGNSWIYLWIILGVGEVYLRASKKEKPYLITAEGVL
jgi:O-antigen ligase